jgi:hypothetical protein
MGCGVKVDDGRCYLGVSKRFRGNAILILGMLSKYLIYNCKLWDGWPPHPQQMGALAVRVAGPLRPPFIATVRDAAATQGTR